MKKFFPILIIAVSLIAPCASLADVLVVQSLPIRPYDDALSGFRSACGQRIKKVIGQDLSKEEIVDKVRSENPDLVLAIGMDALFKLKSVKNVPIVYVMVLNPRAIAGDSDNIRGVSMNLAPERQMSILRELLPEVKRIGVLFDPAKSGLYVGRINNSASIMGVELLTKQVHSSRDAVSAVDWIKGKVDALWLLPDTTVVTPSSIDLLLLSAIEKKIPVITFSEKYVEKGALVSMEVDSYGSGRQAGEMAQKVLAGKNVASLKEEDARECSLTINQIIAKKLGIVVKSNFFKHARIIK